MDSRHQRDFEFLTSALEDGLILLRDKEEEWGFRFEEVKRQSAQRLPRIASDSEFWLLLQEVIARLHASHTGVGMEVASLVRPRPFGLPFEVRHIAGRYHVAGWREGASPVRGVEVGDEVVAVGGLSIERLREVHEQYEGFPTRATQRAALAGAIRRIFSFYLPAHDFEAPAEVDLVSGDGRRRTHRVPWMHIPDRVVEQPPQDVFTHRWMRQTPRLAYLRVRDFCFPDQGDSRVILECLDAVFSEIRGADGLIIDVRGNGGGLYPPMKAVIARVIQGPVPKFKRRWLVSENFLRYHELGNRFAGTRGLTDWMFEGGRDEATIAPLTGLGLSRRIPIVMITDGGTLSRAEELTAILQEAGVVRTLGETTGGGYACPLQVSLPETGWKFSYAVGEGRSPRGYNIEGRGVSPDVPVTLEPADLISGRDRYLEEAERLVLDMI